MGSDKKNLAHFVNKGHNVCLICARFWMPLLLKCTETRKKQRFFNVLGASRDKIADVSF